MESANYLCSYIEQIVNYNFQNGVIMIMDRNKLHNNLTIHCLCGVLLSDFESDSKKKYHIRRCINNKFNECYQKNIALRQNQLLEQARIDMENGLFDN